MRLKCARWGFRLHLRSTGGYGPCDGGELVSLCQKPLSWTKHDSGSRELNVGKPFRRAQSRSSKTYFGTVIPCAL